MPKIPEKATDFIFWHKRLLDVGGLWPLEPRGFKFYAVLLYSTVHLCAAIAHLAQVFGHFGLMVENFNETALLIMVMAKMPLLKYSSSLKNLMKGIATSDEHENYKNEDEKRIYVSYSTKRFYFLKLSLIVVGIAATAFYFKALLQFIIAEIFGVGTKMYMMPYHVHIFMNITDIRIYLLVYAYQCPMIYVFLCHCTIACFMWSLVIHVCGQLSVMTFRIKNIKEKNGGQLESVFRQIITDHNEIIRTSKDLERIFRLFLLDEILICSIVVGLCGYNIIVLNSNLEDVFAIFCYVMFLSGMLMIMYGWCLVGDFLRQESLSVLDAYYECEWYNMPLRCQKLIITCMIRARRPLYISGGGFYIYTLTSFTSVVRSAVTYLSMLRQVD